MKKMIVITSLSSLLLVGCSQIESLTEKVPFLQKKENNSQNASENNKESSKNTTSQEENQESQAALKLKAEFFNEIKMVDGKKVIQNPTNYLVLVNKDYSFPDGYTPEDLVRPNVLFSFGDQDIEKSYLREAAAKALEMLFLEGKKNGIDLFAVSGYRSYDRQVAVFNAEVSKYGEEKAVQAVAIPGSSEHQTGLSMDLSSQSANFELSERFGETIEGKWIAENAHRFGFILRYPKGKEGITGYKYEPWHFRYVGIDPAKAIYQNQLTLEEYFNIVQKI